MQPITIAFFKAPTLLGTELYHMFQDSMKGYVLSGHPVQVVEQTVYKMKPAIMACLAFDVVIFDGSIENDENEQYRAAVELMKCLDHVLIVSRTPLPFNFSGMRRGGAPGLLKTGTSKYGNKMTNDEILRWILSTLEHSSMELPRGLKLKLKANEFERNMQQIIAVETKMAWDSEMRIQGKQGVFVSYLSRYSKFYHGKSPDEPYVEDLFKNISEISQVSMDEIRYFPPGEISLEFMTGQRRFEIASIAEKAIVDCKAFWIYDTPDYASSWWTFGERMALVHIFDKAIDKCPDIYVIRPEKDETGTWRFTIKKYLTPKEKRAFLPKLNDYYKRELERFYINSNPETEGYEQIEKMRKLAQMPDLLLKMQLKMEAPFVAAKARMALENADIEESEKKKALNEILDIDMQIESIRSYVYTREFWENHIVECPVCRAASGKNVDIEKYMYFRAPYFHSIASGEYNAIMKVVKQGKICRINLPCGHSVSVRKNGAYYRWWTVKGDMPTGPDGRLLEKVDIISFSDKGE